MKCNNRNQESDFGFEPLPWVLFGMLSMQLAFLLARPCPAPVSQSMDDSDLILLSEDVYECVVDTDFDHPSNIHCALVYDDFGEVGDVETDGC